jgi:hypothetical protein
MECCPAERFVVENDAEPPIRPVVPSVVPLSLNVIVPVGVPVPEDGATVAVNITLWP